MIYYPQTEVEVILLQVVHQHGHQGNVTEFEFPHLGKSASEIVKDLVDGDSAVGSHGIRSDDLRPDPPNAAS